MSNPNLKARPHWAKMFQTVPLNNLVPHLKKCYGANWDKWAQLRNQADPTKMFLNDYVEQMFYGPLDPPTVDLTAPIKVNTTEIIESHMKLIDNAHPLDNKVNLYNKEKLESVIKAEKDRQHHHHHEHKDGAKSPEKEHHHHHEHKDGAKSPEKEHHHHHEHSKDSKGSRSPTPTTQATDAQKPKNESSMEKHKEGRKSPEKEHQHHHKDSQSTTSSKKSRKPRSKSTNTEQKKDEEKKKTVAPTEIAVEDEDKEAEQKSEQPTEQPKTTEAKPKRQRSKSCIIS